jgi:hypothetical protein
MQIDLEKLQKIFGKEYADALKKVLEVREDRLSQYGNTFIDDDFMFLYYQVLNKMKRFSLQLDRTDGIEKIKNKDVALDSAVDCVNYGLFIVSKLLIDE